jgi:hypothetical protein
MESAHSRLKAGSARAICVDLNQETGFFRNIAAFSAAVPYLAAAFNCSAAK